MVLVQHLARGGEIEVVLGLDVPGEVREPLEVGAQQVAVRSVGGEGAQALQLAVRLLPGLGRKVRRLEALLELVDLAVGAVALAELGLDVVHAAAQDALALLGVDLLRGRGGEVLLGLGDGDLPLEVGDEAPEARHRVGLLEQGHPFVAGQADVGGDQIGEEARRRELLEALLPLVGDVLAQVDHPLGELEHPGARALELGTGLARLREGLDAREEGPVPGLDGDQARAEQADDDRLLAFAPRIDDAHDARDAGDRVEIRETRLLGGRILLGGDHQEAAGAGGVERGQGARPPDGEGNRHPRKHHRIPHGQDRQYAGNLDALLADRHRMACALFRQLSLRGER